MDWKLNRVKCPVCGKEVTISALRYHAEKHAAERGARLVDPRLNLWRLPSGVVVAGTGLHLLRRLAGT